MATQENVVTATEKTVEDIRSGALANLAEQFSDLEPTTGETEVETVQPDEPVLSQDAEVLEEPDKEETEEVTTEETPEETTEESTKEEAEETVTEDEGKHSLDPDTQAKIDRRIARITAKAKATQEALEAKLAETEAKLQSNSKADSTAPASVIDTITDVDGLKVAQKEAENAVQIADTLLANLDSKPTEVENYLKQMNVSCGDDGSGNYLIDSMRDTIMGISRNANKSLREIPRRENFLSGQESTLQKVYEEMPELKDEHSDEREAFDKFVQDFPGIKSSKDWPKAALKYVQGTLKKTLKAPPKPPRTSGKPRSSPASNRSTATDKSGKTTDWDALAKGDKDERLSLIESYL